MAIIIPSKNIYEINNQKVVDNEVDNIEVSAKTVENVSEYGVNVYSNDVINGKKTIEEVQDFAFDVWAYTPNRVVVALKLEAEYRTCDVKIPIKAGGSTIIRSLILGAGESGQPNIGLRLFGKKKTSQAKTDVVYQGTYGQESEKSKYTINWSNISVYGTKETEGDYTLEKEYKNEYHDSFAGYTLNAEISLSVDEGNLSSVSEQKDEEEFLIKNIKVLSGIKITKLTSDFNSSTTGPSSGAQIPPVTAPMNGTVEEYTPTIVELTFKGNTIGINLKDETVKIGDGQHVYSFEGNELMQTSNKYNTPTTLSIGDFVRDDGSDFAIYEVVQATPKLHSGDVLIYKNEVAQCVSSDPTRLSVQKNGEWAKLSNVQSSFVVNRPINQIENSYNNIISKWKNGKELATLKCGLNDFYYTETREESTDIQIRYAGTISSPRFRYAFYNNGQVEVGDRLVNSDMDLTVQSKELIVGKGTCLLCTGTINTTIQEGQSLDVKLLQTTALAVSPTQKYGVPMTIKIGDVVLPYVKGADGNDKPMSLYMDRITPKEFLVIGKGLVADGEILQELTLQEVTKE